MARRAGEGWVSILGGNQHFPWDTGEAVTSLEWRSIPGRRLFEDLTMLASNENSWLLELFSSLSPQGRAVVSLYLVEGESVRGVAETLDLTPGEGEAWLEHGLRGIR